jgi:hypothetical protein
MAFPHATAHSGPNSTSLSEPFLAFLHAVDAMVRFGIRPMGSEVGSYACQPAIYFEKLFFHLILHPVQSLHKHLLPLNNQIDFMVETFNHQIDLMLEAFDNQIYFMLETFGNQIYLMLETFDGLIYLVLERSQESVQVSLSLFALFGEQSFQKLLIIFIHRRPPV